MSFKWETDEKTGPQTTAETDTSSAPRSLLRRLLPPTAAILLLALATFALWRTVQRRAAAAEAQVKTDVIAAHRLVRSAAARQDAELFQALLSTTDDAWTATQQEQLEANILFARAPALFGLRPLPGSEQRPDVTLDPTLSRAVVEVQQSFVLTAVQGLTQTVQLRQTHAYSRTGNSWLLAPPPPDFWSPRARIHGEGVSIAYPARDETSALRLLTDLERLLPEMCDLPGLRCPRNLHLQLRLSHEPATLTAAADPQAMLAGDGELVLPTPSLVGQPIDEAGRQLLSRAYSTHVVASLITRFADYECCRHGLFFSALVARQLHHLGLQTWPLQPSDYQRLMEEGLSLGDAQVLLEREPLPLTSDHGRRALALVEFLEAALPPDILLLALDGAFYRWLATQQEPEQGFAVEWTGFLQRRARFGRGAAEGPAPRGHLYAACRPHDDKATVWRYDFTSETWHSELQHDPAPRWDVTALAVLPRGNGYLLQEHRRNADGLGAAARFLWYHGGKETQLLQRSSQGDSARINASFSAGDPLGRFVALYLQAPSSGTPAGWGLLNLAQCAAGDCDPLPLAGHPIWSPDGRHTLLKAEPDNGNPTPPNPRLLLRGNEGGQEAVPLAHGYSPFWLDDDHYGYLRPTEDSANQELVIVSAGIQAGVVAGSSDFEQALDEELRPDQWLRLDHVSASPATPQRLIVTVSLWPEDPNLSTPTVYLFALHLSADRQRVESIERLLHTTDYSHRLTVHLSPNGRWLAATGYNRWIIVNLDTGHSYVLGNYNGSLTWSPDGHWLAERRDQHLLLHAPASAQAARTNHALPRDLRECWDVFWHEAGE